MLHSVPALVDELESLLISGKDPTPLLAKVRWTHLVDWPTNLGQAHELKRRLGQVQALLNGLQAPVRAALMVLDGSATYGPGPAGLPGPRGRFQRQV